MNDILSRKPPRTPEAEAWMETEAAEQKKRYAKIEQETNVDLEGQREQWYREFEERIQTRGFNWHADNLRIIKPEEIYPKPDREHKVVY